MTKKFPTPKRTDFSGADQHCAMLISALDGGHSEYNAATVAKYRDRAQQILRSPHAFTGVLEVLNVTDIIVNDTLRQDRSVGLDQRAYRQMVAAIFDGDEREMVTASALELRGMGYHAISEATLYGAALMFELLKGSGER